MRRQRWFLIAGGAGLLAGYEGYKYGRARGWWPFGRRGARRRHDAAIDAQDWPAEPFTRKSAVEVEDPETELDYEDENVRWVA